MLCAGTAAGASAPPDSSFEDGLARFQRRDFAGALPALERAHAQAPDDLDAALVLGITYYRLGHGAKATPLLEAAARSPEPETAGAARVFLGLIADAAGDQERARAYFGAVAASPASGLAVDAREWLDGTRPAGPAQLVGDLLVRPEYDSNVALQPGAGAGADGDLFVLASLGWRPFAGELLVEDSAGYRRQARLDQYDLVSNDLALRHAIVGERQRLALAYHFDAAWLAGASYYLGHVGEARWRHDAGERGALGLRYTLSYRDYAAAGYTGYTGANHTGALEASFGGPTLRLDASVLLVRDDVAAAELRSSGAGGELALDAWFTPHVGLRLYGATTARRFDAASSGRQDVQLRAQATLVVGLSSAVALVVDGGALRNLSNDPGYDYARFIASLGLSFGFSEE